VTLTFHIAAEAITFQS